MTDSAESRFVYVTYIRTTAEKLWAALTSPDFAEKYWRGARPVADWRPGGAWKLVFPDGRVADAGEFVAFEPESASRSSGATNSSRNSRRRTGRSARWRSSPWAKRSS